jgi:hypothetical protein
VTQENPGNGTSITVRTTTLDKVAGNLQPGLVKLDVELRCCARFAASSGCSLPMAQFVAEVENEHLKRQRSTLVHLFELFHLHGYTCRSLRSGPNWRFSRNVPGSMTQFAERWEP